MGARLRTPPPLLINVTKHVSNTLKFVFYELIHIRRMRSRPSWERHHLRGQAQVARTRNHSSRKSLVFNMKISKRGLRLRYTYHTTTLFSQTFMVFCSVLPRLKPVAMKAGSMRALACRQPSSSLRFRADAPVAPPSSGVVPFLVRLRSAVFVSR